MFFKGPAGRAGAQGLDAGKRRTRTLGQPCDECLAGGCKFRIGVHRIYRAPCKAALAVDGVAQHQQLLRANGPDAA
ncbi:Uncharacterised protein [Mycobacterium tuberculosis]|nr:Uncharacterised protein [Mycobacterium tuberculosis]